MAAIKQDDLLLKFANDNIKNNKKMVLAAINQNAKACQFMGEKSQNNNAFQKKIGHCNHHPRSKKTKLCKAEKVKVPKMNAVKSHTLYQNNKSYQFTSIFKKHDETKPSWEKALRKIGLFH
jgi:hypothetical protein